MLQRQISTHATEPLLEVYHSEEKGRGIRTKRAFLKDDFVCEYKGTSLILYRSTATGPPLDRVGPPLGLVGPQLDKARPPIRPPPDRVGPSLGLAGPQVD